MAFFDKIGETISSKSKGVAQKAKDLAEVSDLNKQINQCNQKINDSYMEIGYYYYQAHKDDGDDPFAAQCANIRQAMDQADALRAQIQVIKGVKVCPNCHAEIPKDSQLCGYCGCRITPQGQAMPQNSAPYGQVDVQQPFGQPQAPGYEQQPVYGQPQTPGYEQPAPAYGEAPQAAPVYEQPAPAYGEAPQAAPVYEQPAPAYGEAPQVAPVYEQPAPAYVEAPQAAPVPEQPAPAYGEEPPQSAPVYEQPAPAESQPLPSLEKTQSAFSSEVSPSVCPGCGSPVAEEDVFCGECGRKLK